MIPVLNGVLTGGACPSVSTEQASRPDKSLKSSPTEAILWGCLFFMKHRREYYEEACVAREKSPGASGQSSITEATNSPRCTEKPVIP